MGVRGKALSLAAGKGCRKNFLIICKKPLAFFVEPAIIPISSNHERDNGVTYLQKYVTPFPIRTKACRPCCRAARLLLLDEKRETDKTVHGKRGSHNEKA